MRTFKEWLETQYDEETRQMILNEIPHGSMLSGPIPPELKFLQGFVDFGFENLGLTPAAKRELHDAFASRGVAVPGTRWKLRYRGGMGVLVEPMDGSEPVLPNHWKQAVYVLSVSDVFTWIGKRVRPEQLGVPIDFNLYRDVGDGWELL